MHVKPEKTYRSVPLALAYIISDNTQVSAQKLKNKQGDRGDMRTIHVTRQFFEGSGRHGDFFEKNK